MVWLALAQLGGVVLLSPIIILIGALGHQACAILWQSWRYRHLPGPRPHLLLGNLPDIVKHGASHVAYQSFHEQYGPICKFFFARNMFILVADPDLAHQLMFKLSSRPDIVNPVVQLLPEDHKQLDRQGLVTVRGNLWRMLRNAWQPVFAPSSLRHYQQLMSSSAQQLVDVLAQGTDTTKQAGDGNASLPSRNGHASNGSHKQYIDLHTLFNQMTLDVVGTCAYGVKFNALGGQSEQTTTHSGLDGLGPLLQKACRDFFSVTTLTTGSKYALRAAIMPALTPVISWMAQTFPDPKYIKMLNARKMIGGAGDTLIKDWQDRAQQLTEAPANGTTAAASKPEAVTGVKRSGVEPGSFLGLLLQAQHKAALNKSPDQLDNVTLSAQAHTFTIAGTETTANTLTFAVYFLCQHPDKLDRLLQEVDAHGRDKPTGPEDEFPYVDAVIKETMRLLPAAPTTSRVVDTPEGIQVGPHKVHSGAFLMFPSYTMHRASDMWPCADEFLPERWLPEGKKELGPRNQNAYMPFGAGPRMCIGWKFALQEARIALVQVYKNFTFKLQPGQVPLRVAASLLLSPKHGLLVQASPRSKPVQ